MTFEQTMHTLESHLEALQEQHNNEVMKLRHQLLEMQEKARDYSKRCQELQEENNHLKEKLKALSDEDTLLARDMIVFASELSKALEGKPNDQ